MSDWRFGFGAVVFVVVMLALLLLMLTARNRSYVDSKRTIQRRRFRPDWDRNRPEDSTKRRGIHIRR